MHDMICLLYSMPVLFHGRILIFNGRKWWWRCSDELRDWTNGYQARTVSYLHLLSIFRRFCNWRAGEVKWLRGWRCVVVLWRAVRSTRVVVCGIARLCSNLGIGRCRRIIDELSVTAKLVIVSIINEVV